MPTQKDDTSQEAKNEKDAAKTEVEKVESAAPDPKKEPEKTGATSEPAAKPAASGSGKKILIVEDERPLAHALELKFSHEGFETKTCGDGQEGLTEALSGQYAVVLLDLIMPQLDGFGFLEKMNADGIKTPVIVLSNLGQDEDKKKATELGAIDYFVKSNTPIIKIVERVRSAI